MKVIDLINTLLTNNEIKIKYRYESWIEDLLYSGSIFNIPYELENKEINCFLIENNIIYLLLEKE